MHCEHRAGRQILLMEPDNLEDDHEESDEIEYEEDDTRDVCERIGAVPVFTLMVNTLAIGYGLHR